MGTHPIFESDFDCLTDKNSVKKSDKMVKFMKPGKVCIVLAGKYAGKKAIIVKQQDDGTQDRAYGHALVAGIERYPRKVTKSMGKKKLTKRSRVKPFVKVVNYNHLMPTRYSVDVNVNKGVVNKETIKDAAGKRKCKAHVKQVFEERYKAGKNKWFFQKLRFQIFLLSLCRRDFFWSF